MGDRYDYAVVGGGIAGLAAAEMFARHGYKTLLIERNDKLCQEASASQAGWFHFGSLYCMFPQPQFLRTLVGGVEDLIDHYASAPGMNIRVANDGKLMFETRADSWFRDEPIEYMVAARNNPDFDMRRFDGLSNYLKKIFFLGTWEFAIKQFVSRHLRFHRHDWRGRGAKSAAALIPAAGWSDYRRDVIEKPDNPNCKLDPDTHFLVKGFDRPMDVNVIMADLLGSLVAHGGTVRTGCAVDAISEDDRGGKVIAAGDDQFIARHVISAAGKWTGDIGGSAVNAKVVVSPIMVVYPAVDDHNLVRMTPFVEKTLNHLYHEVDGRRYSVIGGGHSADPNDPVAVKAAEDALHKMALKAYPQINDAEITGFYLGYKTEIPGKAGERNYQYFIRKLDPAMTVIVPGKFSLAFSLAVNLFKAVTGHDPSAAMGRTDDPALLRGYFGYTSHASIARGDRDKVA